MRTRQLLDRVLARAADDPRSLNPADRLLGAVRGGLNPFLLRSKGIGYDISRTLLVVGFPRSGTTWLAELLAKLPNAGMLFEPLDIRRISAARDAGLDWENFREPHEYWPEGERFMRSVLSGRVLTPWTTSQIPLSRARSVDRWVVKLVRGNMLLGWIVSHFNLPPPILLVRHPCAVFDSWVRRGWPIHEQPPSARLRFFETYPHFRQAVSRLRHPEQHFAADWAMQHFAPLNQLEEERYQLCYYERLQANGPIELDRIFKRWNLPLPETLAQGLERPSAKSSGLANTAPGQHASWRGRLDSKVVERMMDVLDEFGLDLYAD